MSGGRESLSGANNLSGAATLSSIYRNMAEACVNPASAGGLAVMSGAMPSAAAASGAKATDPAVMAGATSGTE